MDWLTFTTRLIEHAAWPTCIIILCIILRKELRQLFPYLKRLKAGPIEAEFEREIKEIKAATELPAPGEPIILQTSYNPILTQLTNINPRSAILEAWHEVENAAGSAIENHAIELPVRDAKSPFRIIRALNKGGLLSPEEIDLFHSLRSLRNHAAHINDFNPTPEAALNFIDLSERLKSVLLKVAQVKTAKPPNTFK